MHKNINNTGMTERDREGAYKRTLLFLASSRFVHNIDCNKEAQNEHTYMC